MNKIVYIIFFYKDCYRNAEISLQNYMQYKLIKLMKCQGQGQGQIKCMKYVSHEPVAIQYYRVGGGIAVSINDIRVVIQ